MKIFIQVQQDNRLTGWSSTRGTDEEIEIEVPNNHEVLKAPFVFTYQNGQLLKDEAFQQQLIKEQEEREKQPSIDEKLSLMAKAIDDLILGGAF